jgi:hypothetical protein
VSARTIGRARRTLAPLVTVVKAVTWLGSNGVLWAVIGAAAVGLALRKRPNADSRPSGRDSRRTGRRSSEVRPSGQPSSIADRLRA